MSRDPWRRTDSLAYLGSRRPPASRVAGPVEMRCQSVPRCRRGTPATTTCHIRVGLDIASTPTVDHRKGNGLRRRFSTNMPTLRALIRPASGSFTGQDAPWRQPRLATTSRPVR
jgi:hypothetical protein